MQCVPVNPVYYNIPLIDLTPATATFCQGKDMTCKILIKTTSRVTFVT
jgi:hypothetical protein